MRINPGDCFGNYEVVERVGEGGMGVVYRAVDRALGREVALKVIAPGLGAGSAFAERLRGEARALAALNHPHILTIYEIGEAEGVPFLVLEWMGGGTLAASSVARPLTLTRFQQVALPVAEALGAAHQRQIVHRDVKPGNVLMGADGRVKLADFGLAYLRRLDPDATRTAGLLGTYAYMSPEQANEGDIGPASDVFSFGILAYELLTGELPFKGPGPASVLAAVVAGRYAPLSGRTEIPTDLAAVVDRCLRREPADRFVDGDDLASALRQALTMAAESARKVATDGPPAAERDGQQEQEIHYSTTADGYALAYSVIGRGPMIVRVLGYFTHLEMEWEWPELRRFWEALAEHFTVVRYDGRGMGLSDRYTGEFTEATRQSDLEAVLAAVGGERVALLGISEGGWTAATYAVEHPERVSHLLLYGAYCRGAQVRPGYDAEEDEALVTLVRKGWGRDTPAFRQVYTSQFFGKDADPRLVAHFNELQRVSTSAETAARYMQGIHRRGDGRDIFRQVAVPTLVVHSRDDLAVSAEEGRLLASTIAGAQLVIVPKSAHYFPIDDQVLARTASAITRFLQTAT